MLIGAIASRGAARHPDKTAVIEGDRRLSFAELDRAIDRFAAALAGHGIGKGARIAILAPNVLEYPIAVFGAARAGAIACLLSSRATAADLVYMLSKTGVELLVHMAALAPTVAAVRPQVPSLRHVVSIGGGNGAAMDFAAFLRSGEAGPPAVEIADSDPVGMTFTGGTTGLPKAVLVNHRNRWTSMRTVSTEFGLDGSDIGIVAAPLFHAVGQFIWFQTLVLMGCTQVMLPRWDAGEFGDLVSRHGATATLLVPTQLGQLVDHERFSPAVLRTLRHVSYAGSPMPLMLYDRLLAELPHVDFVEHYGQSETGPLTIRRPFHPHAKRMTVGLPAQNIDLRIVDRDGRDVGVGEKGELITRGDHVFTRYWDEPEQTAAVYRKGDGWLWTGDVGVRDAEGFITLVDRTKDIIVSGAENIYPTEVESALHRHPAVAECAVFGIPDSRWGEVPAAHIVLRPGHAVTADELIAHVAGQIARFKRPRQIRFVDGLPKTPVGKVQRAVLREPYWAGRDRNI